MVGLLFTHGHTPPATEAKQAANTTDPPGVVAEAPTEGGAVAAGSQSVKPTAGPEPPTRAAWRKLQSPVDILTSCFSLPNEVAVEVGGIVELILQSFVHTWYQWISDDPQLPDDIRQSLAYAFGTLLSLMRTRLHLLSFVGDKVGCLSSYH